MDCGVLVHLCTPATWRMALAAGSLAPPSLLHEGFVHLSTPHQVTWPANALYQGRTDLLALVVDPARLPGELRFERAPDAPAEVRFPHHYGPVPVASVVAVVPYQAGPDGRFTEPNGLPPPEDAVARVRLFDRALAQRRGAAVLPVNGGVAVLDPRYPASHEHNALWMDPGSDAATVAAEADRVLGSAGLSHRRAVLDDPATATALASQGWHILELRLLLYGSAPQPAANVPPGSITVVPVAHEVVSKLWQRSWRRDQPGLDDDAVCQLVDGEALADAVLRVVNLAVLDGYGEPIAATQLRIDGATAAIEAVMTEPAHRRAGLARALVLDALARARAAGCDAIFLTAVAGEWPHRWYTRLGFIDVGSRFQATCARLSPIE
ncbi:MAG: GNAT family N-acetyltransferase [Pseudonocardiales bacterium]|nr:GNAT family N-acetyltransferase [Pseudonocardiales bacterium]